MNRIEALRALREIYMHPALDLILKGRLREIIEVLEGGDDSE